MLHSSYSKKRAKKFDAMWFTNVTRHNRDMWRKRNPALAGRVRLGRLVASLHLCEDAFHPRGRGIGHGAQTVALGRGLDDAAHDLLGLAQEGTQGAEELGAEGLKLGRNVGHG